MTEITQADRDVAATLMNAPSASIAEDVRLAEKAFARHREQAERETVEKIVAWLRSHDFMALDEAADKIEAGEWKQ